MNSMGEEQFRAVTELLSMASAIMLGNGDPENHDHSDMPGRRVCIYKYMRQSDGVSITQYIDPAQPGAIILKMHAPVEEIIAYGNRLAAQARSEDPVVDTLEHILGLPDAEPGTLS